jgi:tetratricopeptide (TPR) repeat protein
LSVYRLAAAQCRRRVAYLRLLGKASATRSDWNEVIDIFEQLREEGDEGEDVVLPLGMAYAGLGRRDADALAVYRQAIALGTREMEIHSLYCHHLYEHNRQSPESIRQFTATLSVCPDCDWAHLGLLRHYLESSDFERALEGALKLLDKEPRDREALGLAGAALAGDFSRRQLARLANARPEVLSRIFDEAYKRQPQAGPIILGRVRRRLAEDIRDEETAQLLRDACRHFPEAMDLRIERADLLWDLGQQDNAVELYRELLGRWRASSVNQIPKGMTPELRRRILFRTAGHLLTAPVLNDVEILMDAAAEPDASPEIILGAAQALVRLQADHPARIPLLEQALRLEPDNVTLERALAEGLAARGRPAPAVRLAIRLADMRKADEDTAALLRSAQAAQRPQELPPALLTALRRSLNEQTIPIPAVALAAADLIMSVRPPEEEDLGLLEYLARALPKNLRVRRWLARALSASGQDSRAAELYSTLIDDESAEPEVVIALARTHARLGMRDKAYLKVAEAAANLEPDDPDLLFHLAGIELDIGHIATAARHLDKVLEAKPEMHPRVLAALENTPMMQTDSRRVLPLTARVHIKAGRNEEALAILSRMLPNYQRHFADMMALYEELIESVPNNPRPRIERAILFRLAGRIDEAISDMRAAHLLAPDSADILHEYAEMIAQKVRSQTPADPQLCVYAGDIFLSAGDEQAALEMALLALDARKDHDPALRLKSRLELAAGRLPDCHETLRRLTDKSLAIEVFEQLARAYAEGGDSFHAAQVLTDCIEAAGPRSELLCQLRTLHQEQDRARREASMRDRLLGTLSDRARRRYELLEEIGSGAMGVVYKAYDRELDEVVVLKILPEHFAEDPEALSQFRNEAKAARKLAHPNIVRIHDFGEDGGRKHISMEYVSGGDLRQLLNRGEELSFQEKLRIVREIIRALAHAHGEGVLHRDIKAANILLTPSRRVKLSDFGIAALLTGEAPPPDDSAYVFGTPIYMSPEQFRGDRPSPATDLYSVGVLLYELMAGQPPFTRGSLSYHHQFTPPERPEAVTDVLWEVMSRLLEKEPEGRFQSAEEVLEALKLFFPE